MTRRSGKVASPAVPMAVQEQLTTLTALQTLLARYTTLVEQAKTSVVSQESIAASPWPSEAQELLEAVEAYLRAQKRTSLVTQPVSRDAQAGFWLDVTERCWIAFEDLLCEICVLFGMRGSGKSNSVAFILEQLLLRGVGMSIIDPHGEYSTLRALNVPLLVVGIAGGKANQPDLVVEPDLIGAVATFSVKENVSIILDLTGLKKKERHAVLADYFEAIWVALPDREIRRPYHLCLEEAHAYIPEGTGSPVTDIVSDLITEYRKFGLGALIIDQRPARVRKTPITQARVRILHQVNDPIDIGRYKETAPRRAKNMEALLETFLPGTALVQNHSSLEVVQIKERTTVHLGATPTLEGITPIVEVVHDEHLIAGLQQALTIAPRRERLEGMNPTATHRLHEALEQLAQAEQRVELLTGQNTVLREQITLLLSQLQTVGIDVPSLPIVGENRLIEPVSSTLDIAEARIGRVEITPFASQDGTPAPGDLFHLLLQAQAALEQKGQELARAEARSEALRLQMERLKKSTKLRSSEEPIAGPLGPDSMPVAQVPPALDKQSDVGGGLQEELRQTRKTLYERSLVLSQVNKALTLAQQKVSDLEARPQGQEGDKTEGGAEKGTDALAVSLPEAAILQTEKELLARQVNRVRNLSSLEKRLFRWLLEHQNRTYTLTQLSQKTGVPRGHLYAKNLARLTLLDFVIKGTSPQCYSVVLTPYWKTNLASYPDVKVIQELLWQAAQEKL